MSNIKKVNNNHLSLVKKDSSAESFASEVRVVSYEKLSTEQLAYLNKYNAITRSDGNCVGALISLENWDVRPLVIENNKLTISRFSEPTKFTEQQWNKRIFFQSTLKDQLPSFVQLSFSEKKQICLQLARLLKKYHDKKIFHGNICLSNIAWQDNKPHFLDFGFAASSSHCKTIGSLAPELRRGAMVSRAADIYGLGKVFVSLIDSIKSLPLANLIDEMTHADPEKRADLNRVIDFFEDRKPAPVAAENSSDLLNPAGKERKKAKEDMGNDSSHFSPRTIKWYISGLLLGLFMSYYFYPRIPANDIITESVYDQSSYLQLWQSGQPSMMQIVARAAIEKSDKTAESIIVKDVMSGKDFKLVNAPLIRIAYDPKWETSLNQNDRRIILTLSMAGLFNIDMPAMPNLKSGSPVVLLSILGALPIDTPVKELLDISVERLIQLPAPYDVAFREYVKFKNGKLEDISVRALAHIVLGSFDDKIIESFFSNAKKDVDVFKMVRIIIPLFPSIKDLDTQVYGYLVTRSQIFAQAYRWFDEENLSDWNGISRGDKIGLVTGIFSSKALPFEKYADLLKHPNPKVSKEAAAIINAKFYSGKMQKMLEFLASDKNRLSRYQTISILAALSLEGKAASDFYTKWFNSKPEVNSVASLLVIRSDSPANDLFNLTAAQYLKEKPWTASLLVLKKLVMHPEALARALAYAKLDKNKPEELSLLNSMSIAEPNPRLREEILRIIGQ